MLRTTFVVWLAAAILLGAFAQRPEVPETDETRIPPPPQEAPAPPISPLDLSTVVKGLSAATSRQQTDVVAARLVTAFSDSTAGQVREAVSALGLVRDQPLIIASLIGYFEGLRAEEHTRRVTTLAIIGELRRMDAAPFLQKVIWARLPSSESAGERMAVTGLQEMTRVKAVHGLAYLRTTETDRVLIDIARRHDSAAIRLAAIDSYMWNHDDSHSAAQTLFDQVPSDLHKFVQRPRFHAGADRKQFNDRLRAWQEKWASPQAKP